MDTEHKRPRILDVDGDERRRSATKRLLDGAGLSVIDDACAHDAIAAMHAERPDAVLVDTVLPDGGSVRTAFELCRRIRADAAIAATPVVCLSTELADANQRVRALVAGADAALARPVDARELVATVHAVMRRAHGTLIASEAVDATKSRRVLIVEDNDDALWALRLLCESWGHRVVVASDGMNGLALALAEPPDVALVDVGLPVLDGYEVARRIRASTATPPLLVALTGYGAPDDRETALRAGFDVHLVKPVSPETLARLLQVTTKNRHEWSANRSAVNGKSVFDCERGDTLDLLWT